MSPFYVKDKTWIDMRLPMEESDLLNYGLEEKEIEDFKAQQQKYSVFAQKPLALVSYFEHVAGEKGYSGIDEVNLLAVAGNENAMELVKWYVDVNEVSKQHNNLTFEQYADIVLAIEKPKVFNN